MSKAILVDTPILLWLRADPARLTDSERRIIDAAPCRYVSAVSFWEIALLIGLGRIDNDARIFSLPEGMDLLSVEPEHCRTLVDLPTVHRDPFDRMLIAQARADHLLLVTRDRKIISYGRAGAMTAPL